MNPGKRISTSVPPPAAHEATAPTRRDDHVYEELSRTNNELANLHREVACQNAELAAAQKKLQASEQRYRSLTACSPIAILEMDGAGRCLYTNPHWQAITGLSEEQSLGDGWQAALDKRDGAAFLEDWNPAQPAGQDFSREVRLVTTRGDQRWAQVRSRAMLTLGCEITGRVCTVEDITARKLAAEATSVSDERFRLLVKATNDAIWDWDLVTNRFWWNEGIEKLFGYRHDGLDPTSGSWTNHIHPEDLTRVTDGIHHTMEQGEESWLIEYRFKCQDGRYVWVLDRGHIIRDGAGRTIRMIGGMTDQTERKSAADALQRQQAELRVLFNLMPAMIWFKDTHNRILRVNQSVAEAVGKRVGEIEGKPSLEIYPQDAARFYADDLEVMRSRVPKLGYVETVRCPDGEDLWVQTDKVPYFDEDGTVIGIVVMAQDITGRKRAEAELEKTHSELLGASRLAGMAEVAVSVLHNVGNVLNSVNVASTMLAERLRNSKITSLSQVAELVLRHECDLAAFFNGDPKGRQLPGYLAKLAAHLSVERESALKELAGLQDHIEHIKHIVNMQQGFAKISGITEKLLAADLAEDALTLDSTSLATHKIVVRRDYQNIPPVTLEKHKVLQILVNLLRNATQACVEAGREEKCLILGISSADDRVRFSVRDNGVGIVPENLTRIFAHGFTTKPGGHGFGLHGAALAAAEMGGSLTVHSDGSGCGATFTLELPLQQK